MKTFYKIFLFLFIVSFTNNIQAQSRNKNIQFFGGFGLSINSEFFSFSVQPGILYHVSPKFKIGTAVQYSYAKSNRDYYAVRFSRNMYGGNALALYYPVSHLEISSEYEILHIDEIYNSVKNKYWSPALFGGVGYYSKNFAVGFKFDFLHSEKSIYKEALIPYVRIYF